jgi:hypothetical protein
MTQNDTNAAKKLGTGLHAYMSPNFVENGNVLFASTLTKVGF